MKRNVRYLCPAFGDGGAGAVSTGVLLEMGCRGGTAPTRQHELRSMVAEHAVEVLRESSTAWDEFAPVAVQVLAPERTLLAKLALLHDGAARSDDIAHERLLKAGRHLYDAHMLLASVQVISALRDLGPDGVAQLCSDIDNHSARAGFSFTPRPEGGYGESPLLDPSAPCRSTCARLQDSDGVGIRTAASFDDCINTIRAHATLL